MAPTAGKLSGSITVPRIVFNTVSASPAEAEADESAESVFGCCESLAEAEADASAESVSGCCESPAEAEADASAESVFGCCGSWATAVGFEIAS